MLKRYSFGLAIAVLGLSGGPAAAQITADDTLPTSSKVEGSDLDVEIRGGTPADGNLFHSFREFSVAAEGSATFFHDLDVQRIFSRVTGNSISEIDGTLRTHGSADLFLINPNGIRFGPDARLDIGGSFVATTAERVNFADGTAFATATPQAAALTVSVPVGLQFGNSAAAIASQARGSGAVARGLEVGSGRTLALVGGDVAIDRGDLLVNGGTIELAGVGPGSRVALASAALGWELDFSAATEFRDLSLQEAFASTSDEIGTSTRGEINLTGRHIHLSSSILEEFDTGRRSRTETLKSPTARPALDPADAGITIVASESAVISANTLLTTSSVESAAESAPDSGDIRIEAPRLHVANSFIVTASLLSPGDGGDIVMEAGNVTLEGASIFAGSFGPIEFDLLLDLFPSLGNADRSDLDELDEGDSGNVIVKADQVQLRRSAFISVETVGSDGDAGEITVNARDRLRIDSTGVGGNTPPSAISSRTFRDATGAGGDSTFETAHLQLVNGGRILSSTTEGSSGNAGQVTVRADRIEIRGAGSAIEAESNTEGDAGNIIILRATELTASDRGRISTSATDTGAAGNLDIRVTRVTLESGGVLAAETRAGQGNIRIATEHLRLRGDSRISTEASGAATGGNITIGPLAPAAPLENSVVVLDTSTITARAENGNSGNITIDALVVLFPPDSIRASAEFVINGEAEPAYERGRIDLASEVGLPELLQGCGAIAGQSRFTHYGRGGVAVSPEEPPAATSIWEDLAIAAPPAPAPVEATSWRREGDRVVLAAPPPEAADCQFSARGTEAG